MFGYNSNDKVTLVTLGLGLLASSAAVAHGLVNLNISTSVIGIATVTIFVYILSRKGSGEHHD